MHIHWYKFHHDAGVNRYLECRCGKRRVLRGGGWSPIDRHWLEGGSESDRPGPPVAPPKPSDAGRSA